MKFTKVVVLLLVHILWNVLEIKGRVTGSNYSNEKEGKAVQQAFKYLDEHGLGRE